MNSSSAYSKHISESAGQVLLRCFHKPQSAKAHFAPRFPRLASGEFPDQKFVLQLEYQTSAGRPKVLSTPKQVPAVMSVARALLILHKVEAKPTRKVVLVVKSSSDEHQREAVMSALIREGFTNIHWHGAYLFCTTKVKRLLSPNSFLRILHATAHQHCDLFS